MFIFSFPHHLQFIITTQHETISVSIKRLINNFPSPLLSSVCLSVRLFCDPPVRESWMWALRGGHARSCSEYGGLHLLESEESPVKIPASNRLVRLLSHYYSRVLQCGGFLSGLWWNAVMFAAVLSLQRQTAERVYIYCMYLQCSSSSSSSVRSVATFSLFIPAEGF